MKAGVIGYVIVGVETVPITVCGVGETTPRDWQAASAHAPRRTAAMRAVRRTVRDSNEAVRPPAAGPVALVAGVPSLL